MTRRIEVGDVEKVEDLDHRLNLEPFPDLITPRKADVGVDEGIKPHLVSRRQIDRAATVIDGSERPELRLSKQSGCDQRLACGRQRATADLLIERADQIVQRLAVFHSASEGASIRPRQRVCSNAVAVQVAEEYLRRAAVGAGDESGLRQSRSDTGARAESESQGQINRQAHAELMFAIQPGRAKELRRRVVESRA